MLLKKMVPVSVPARVIVEATLFTVASIGLVVDVRVYAILD